MSKTFPLAKRFGYDIDQVEEFLEKARKTFAAEKPEDADMTAQEVRLTAFKLTKKGYAIKSVDLAIERLEDAIAQKEREWKIAEIGLEKWREQTQKLAQEIVDRISLPDRKRFARAGVLRQGYNRKQVDVFLDSLLPVFAGEEQIQLSEIRKVAFSPKSNGYSEVQVDALLDAVVEALQAIE